MRGPHTLMISPAYRCLRDDPALAPRFRLSRNWEIILGAARCRAKQKTQGFIDCSQNNNASFLTHVRHVYPLVFLSTLMAHDGSKYSRLQPCRVYHEAPRVVVIDNRLDIAVMAAAWS